MEEKIIDIVCEKCISRNMKLSEHIDSFYARFRCDVCSNKRIFRVGGTPLFLKGD
jgi:hypothetical protein